MPYFGNTGPRTYDRPALSYGASDQQAAESADRLVGRDFNLAQTVGYYALGGVTDLIDTVGASIPGVSSGLNVERQDFNRFVTRSLDLPGLNDFYFQNKGGIEATSGVGLIIGSELIARRVTAPGGALMSALRQTPYLRRIAALDEQAAAAIGTVRATREELASRGLQGAQQLTAQARVETMLFDGATGSLIPGFVTRSGRGADARVRGLQGLIGIRQAVVTEAVLGTIANQNAFLYDDSAAFNIAMGAIGLGVGGGIGWVGAGYALRRIAQEDQIARKMAGALDPEGLEASRLGSFAAGLTRTRKVDPSIDWFGGSYTDQVSQLGLELTALKNSPLSGTADEAALKSNRLAQGTEVEKLRRATMQKVSVKGIPSDGRTGFSMDSPGYGNHVDKMLHDDPMAMNLVEALGGVPDEQVGSGILEGFARRIDSDKIKTEGEIGDLLADIADKGRATAGQQKRLDELQLKRRRLAFQETWTQHGVIDGELVPPSALATFERFTPPRIFPSRLDKDKTFWEVEADASHGKGILVGDNLEVVLPRRNAPSTVVLARVEPLPGKIPDWIKDGLKGSDQEKAAGRWFLDANDTPRLDWYRNDAGPGAKITYVRVKKADLEKYRVKNIDKTSDGLTPKRFSREPDNEFFLPRDLAGTASSRVPGQIAIESIDYYDQLALFRIADTAIDSLARRGTPVAINLPKKPSWFQLDEAEELLRRTEGRAQVSFPQGMTRESAQVESLVQKAEALKKAQLKGKPKHVGEDEWMHQMRVRLNLPRMTAYEVGILGEAEHPLEFLMRGIGNQDPDAVRALSLDEVKEAVAQTRRLGDAAPVNRSDVKSLYGSSFKFMKDDKGRDMKPLVALTRPFQPFAWSKNEVADRLAMRKQRALQELTGPEADALSRELGQAIIGSPDFQLASRPDMIMEAQIQGSLLGSTPQSWAGAVTKELKPSEWNFRDAPGLLGAGRIRDLAGRITRARMKEVIEGAFGDTLKVLKNPRNAATKLLLNQFHSFRGGWDLGDTIARAAPEGKTMHAFLLKDTAENKSRWEKLFQEPMPKGATLRGENRREVVLDEAGLDLQQRFNSATDYIVDMQNTILRAHGMGQIRKQAWYVPPPDVEGKHVGWILGPDNKIIYAVAGDNPTDFASRRDIAMKRMEEERPDGGYVFMTREQITDYLSVWDRAQMNMVNPGTTAILPGKRSTGGLTGANIQLDAFQNSLKQLETRILNHGSDIVELLFKEQLNAAKARAAFAKAVAPASESRFASSNYRTVHDYYQEALLGRSKSTHPGSQIGGVSRAIEGRLDLALEWAAGPTSRVWGAVVDRLARGTAIWDKGERAKRDFDGLSTQLGERMPFRSAVELGEARERGVTPLTVARMTGGINRFTAAITLRIAEVAHPVMNLAGIVNAMPSVVRQMTPRIGESADQFAARVGHSAMIFRLPTGEQVAAPDITKLFGRALKGAWSRKSSADYDFMMRRGYITQEVAEFQRQFGVIEAPGRWQEGMEKLVKGASILSDKSEDFSRSIGHFIGLEVADIVGITGKERRHAFAHDVANKMIANYDPHNRAEIFQGGLGSMLGLFQSFAHNYYGRLFRYVETKDTRAFMTQYGIQSSLFGITGLTGWDQVSSAIEWASDGERRIDTGVQGAYTGPEGDLLAHGLLSQIPKIVGLPGVDLYSRGDTSVRVPGVGNTSVPGIAAMAKIASGITEGLSALWKENPGLTQTRIAEILSNMVVNRPIAGMIEQFAAHGNDVDGYGQIVSETKGFGEMFMRMAGVRSERQSAELNVYYSDKRAQEQQAAKKERLRLRTRSAIREGRNDLIPGIFEDYVTQGGDPRYFRSWMKRNYEAATQTVGTRRLDELTRDPAAFADVMRYLDAGVGIEEDELAGAEAEAEARVPDGPVSDLSESGASIGF